MHRTGICIVAALSACTAMLRAGDAAAFNFESGKLPSPCILGSSRAAIAAGPDVQVATDSVDPSVRGNVCLNPAQRGGLYIRPDQPDNDLLGRALSKLTISLALCADPLARSVIFLDRLPERTSGKLGYFGFANVVNPTTGKGTLRLNVRISDEQVLTATSAPWVQNEKQWYQVAVVFDEGQVSFYVNGTQLGEPVKIEIAEIPAPVNPPYVLRAANGFSGAFDDLLIVPGKALSEEQLREIGEKGIKSEKVAGLLK